VPQLVSTCSLCKRQRSHGSHDDAGDIFVCDACQADANQFIEIQENIWRDIDGGSDNVPRR